MSKSIKKAKSSLTENGVPQPRANVSHVEKSVGDSEVGLTSLSYEYSARDIERAYDIAYGKNTRILPGKSAELDHTIRKDVAIMAGQRDGLELSVFHASDAPLHHMRDYAHLLAKTTLTHPVAVRTVRMDELLSGDNLIAFITSPSGLQAASYTKRLSGKSNKNTLEFCGFCSYGNISGAAVTMIAAHVLSEEHSSGVTPSGRAVARHHKCDSLNLASTIPFGMMGFHSISTGLVPVTMADIHMYDEFVFVNGKPHIGSHRMQGKAERIEPRAWDALFGWSLTFGKSLMEEEGFFFFGKERPRG